MTFMFVSEFMWSSSLLSGKIGRDILCGDWLAFRRLVGRTDGEPVETVLGLHHTSSVF